MLHQLGRKCCAELKIIKIKIKKTEGGTEGPHKAGLLCFSTFASHMECCVVKLKKESFKNTFGLLADRHQETSRERALGDNNHLNLLTGWWTEQWVAVKREMYQKKVEFAIHSKLRHLHLVNLQGCQFKLEATDPKSFITAKLRGDGR